jgi:dTDP-3-amino-3,4,6-trideoxy-alpha-D-glucose transaminase
MRGNLKTRMRVPAVNLTPQLDETRAAARKHLDEMFERGQFILGGQVAAFEREWAEATGARDSVGVGNGTSAIELCLRDLGFTTARHEVITSALTAPFTAVGVRASGARVRFADVDPDTLLLDADDAGNRAAKKTAAILPVHLYGQPVDLRKFVKLARTLKAALIQDAAQAHGARFCGRPLTDYSRYVCYSFYPTKNLGCLGDGGAIATSGIPAGKRLRSRRDGGRRGGQAAYIEGINSRLDEMQACYLRAFLPKLAAWNADRARTAELYRNGLAGCPGVRLVNTSEESVHHLFVIRAERRDKLREHLAKRGIGTGVHYPAPLHLMPAFRDAGVRRGSLPQAERACREVLSLPLWPYLPESRAMEVVQAVRQFYR